MQECAKSLPEGLDGTLSGLAHEGFYFGECLLDGVEIRRVFGQEEQLGSSLADGGADGFSLVASEVVHDDDVAFLERRDKTLFDIGQEAFRIDGTVDHARGGQAVDAQGAHEGQGFPVPVRNLGKQAFAFPAPPAQARHVGLDPGLVDEDQALRVDLALMLLPVPAPVRDVRPVLLAGMHGFF